MKYGFLVFVCIASMLFARADQFVAKATFDNNEIRLYSSPLAYEVIRDGEKLIYKTPIGLTINGNFCGNEKVVATKTKKYSGKLATPIYKKEFVDLSREETLIDFESFAIRLVARADGVAYRFETKKAAIIDDEIAPITISSLAHVTFARTNAIGWEESVPEFANAYQLKEENGLTFYLPFLFAIDKNVVAVTESDVRDYPIWNFRAVKDTRDGERLESYFSPYPKVVMKGSRRIRVKESEKFIARFATARTLPWRVFTIASSYAKICEADIVYALAAPADENADFSWVKPGNVSWNWWSSFDHRGSENGCTTANFQRFIDLAARAKLKYVILDEGWGDSANIWKFIPAVDVPFLVSDAKKKDVDIILWMAWAQVYGKEEQVAEHFAKLGVKGFKIDFMDRGDARIATFLETFAKACAKHKLVVLYHGVYHPTGLHRKYPNILNYEGVHGLEKMKDPKIAPNKDMPLNDVATFFLRLAAGPMDYTPGAMMNYKVGDYRGSRDIPGSVGTRVHQMALMALYEAPLQMLCDGPKNYLKNLECFDFMSRVPTVWKSTVGVAGSPETFVAIARQAFDDSWYLALIANRDAQTVEIATDFLQEGEWDGDIFRDSRRSNDKPEIYTREKVKLAAGEKLIIKLANGGGFIMHLTPEKKGL